MTTISTIQNHNSYTNCELAGERLNQNVQHENADNGGLGEEEKSFRTALPQVLATTAKNVLLLVFGMTLGFSTNVIAALKLGDDKSLQLSNEEISWLSSINHICVPLGCMLSAAVTTQIGRKRAMMFVTLPFTAAWIIFYYATNVTMMYTSLVLTGLAGGLLEAPVLTYVAEITQPHVRGMLSATSSTSISFGIFTQFLFGNFMPWRQIAAVNTFFPVMAFIALCFVPESPYWLIGKGRLQDAERSLCWLRGWRKPSQVNAEFTALVASLTIPHEATPRPTWKNFTHRTFLRPYLLVSATFFLGHFAGMTTLQTYAGTIFHDLGTPIDKYLATLYLGLVQLTGCLTCVTLVHWTGKRPLTFISTIGNGLCFIAVATFAYMASDGDLDGHRWLPVILLLLAAFFSHTGIRLLPWILTGEVFPAPVRNVASGASGAIGYVFGFLANKMYFSMVGSMTLAGTFWFYGAVSICGAGFLYWFMPETEGRTLHEIERHFAGEVNLLKIKNFRTPINMEVKSKDSVESRL